MTDIRPKPYSLDWTEVGSVGDVNDRFPALVTNADEMFAQLYQDLAQLASDVADGSAIDTSGLVGATGADGAPGRDGEPGEDGLTIVGQTGKTGATGAMGPPGADGADVDECYPLPVINGAPPLAGGEVTITTTGNIDNLDFSDAAVLRMNNATLATIRGLKAGRPGQRLTVISVGAGQVDLAHQDTNSTAENRLLNFATSASSSLAAASGIAIYQYDATTARWRLADFEQGAWITSAFAGGNFTANGLMTWTVDSGDVLQLQYRLSGRTLQVGILLTATTTGGTPNTQLIIGKAAYGGFTAAFGNNQNAAGRTAQNAASLNVNSFVQIVGVSINFFNGISSVTTWPNATNEVNVSGQVFFEVT